MCLLLACWSFAVTSEETAATFEGHGSGLVTGIGGLYYQFGRKTPYASTLGSTMASVVNTQQTFAYAVKNPATFVATGNSSYSSQDTSSLYMWNDKNVEKDTDGKSIFDPSPIGWRLPINGVWSDFPANGVNTVDNLATYTPASAKFPATGCRHNSSSNFTYVSVRALAWTATPSTESTRGHLLRFMSATPEAAAADGRSYGFPTRSIRE